MSLFLGRELNHRRRDHRERAFRSDQQVFEIIAGIVFAQLAEAVPDFAIGEHRFEAERQIAHHAVAQHMMASGIGREQAADLARSLRCQPQRKLLADLLGGGVDVGEHAARLDDHRAVFLIDRADFIHARHIQNERFVSVKRDLPARQAGITALRHDVHARARSDGDNLRDLRDRRRTRHGSRAPLPSPALFVQEGSFVGVFGEKVLRADELGDVVERFGDFVFHAEDYIMAEC